MSSLWNVTECLSVVDLCRAGFQTGMCGTYFLTHWNACCDDSTYHWHQTAAQSMNRAREIYHEFHQFIHEHGLVEEHRELVTQCLLCSPI